jgi:anaphase-promoting complex subunit 1
LDDRLPIWPPDMSGILHGRIRNPEWKVSEHERAFLETLFLGMFTTSRSLAFGKIDPLPHLRGLVSIYMELADGGVADSQKRAENAIQAAVNMDKSIQLSLLPLGLASPIHEAARTCQLSPPAEWSVSGYTMIGRNDLAASVTRVLDMLSNDGYRAVKDHIVSIHSTSSARPCAC